MAERESVEDGFRSALKDVVAIAEKLAPICKTVDEMVEVARLALKNDAQLTLLMERTVSKR